MVIDIGDIITGKINSLPFIDKIAGVVQVLSYKSTDKDKKILIKKFPASCRLTLEECEAGAYKDLCPDSLKKSVLYLEDNGIRFVKREAGKTYWRASMNLACWLNMPLLGYAGCSYSAIAIEGIISKLPVTPFNSGNFQRIQINMVGQQPKNQNPFSKYTYDETIQQFLMYPYDYFVLLLDVDFITDRLCLTAPPLGTPIDCK